PGHRESACLLAAKEQRILNYEPGGKIGGMGEFPVQANIAGTINVRIAGLEAIVHHDPATAGPVILHAGSLQVEPLDVRRTAGPRQNFVHGERLLFSLCLVVDEFSACTALDTGDRRIEAQRYPLTDEGIL